MSIDGSVSEMDKLEESFTEIVQARFMNDPEKKLKINKDSEFTENPMERENIEETLEVDTVKSFAGVISDLQNKNLNLMRVPVVEESAPREVCFDILIDSLKQEPAGTQCVFSCQAGRGRTTLGTYKHIRNTF